MGIEKQEEIGPVAVELARKIEEDNQITAEYNAEIEALNKKYAALHAELDKKHEEEWKLMKRPFDERFEKSLGEIRELKSRIEKGEK